MSSSLKKSNKDKILDWGEFMKEFRSGSDHVVAILGATFLEERLALLLKQFFVADEKSINELVGDGGYTPLGSFSARISAAYALGLLAADERDDLRTIKNIRNTFAHGLQGVSFAASDIAAQCANLKAPRSNPDVEQQPQVARDRFMLSVELLANQLAFRGNDAIRERRSPPGSYSIANLFFSSRSSLDAAE